MRVTSNVSDLMLAGSGTSCCCVTFVSCNCAPLSSTAGNKKRLVLDDQSPEMETVSVHAEKAGERSLMSDVLTRPTYLADIIADHQ